MKMGVTAVAAGLAGLGGIATGLSAAALDTTEEADLLSFDLDGRQVRAWVWTSVFREGDEVEVVAERSDEGWRGYGIRRVADGIVALHPHCSRGRYAHYKKSFALFFKVIAIFFMAFYTMGFIVGLCKSMTLTDVKVIFPPLLAASLTAAAIYGVIAYRIAWKFMGFVRLAEGIFEGFGWRDVKNIDLPAITKRTKQQGEPGPLGVLYFRYNGS